MRKKHNFNIFPLNFEKITDFQFSMAAKRVRVPPFFFNIQMEMGMEHSHAKLQNNSYKMNFAHYFYWNCRQDP